MPTERKSTKPCAKCGAYKITVEEINDHPDLRISCGACHRVYYVDGPDS